VTVLEAEVVKAVPADVPPAFVRKVLARASALPEVAARMPEGRLTLAVRITSDEEMRVLNRTYAADDHATDVLSFTGSGEHVGDIAISWPATQRQAAEHGQDDKTELALLAVHGHEIDVAQMVVRAGERQHIGGVILGGVSAVQLLHLLIARDPNRDRGGAFRQPRGDLGHRRGASQHTPDERWRHGGRNSLDDFRF